jgi:thioredoxin reductase (NADPH)
VSSAPRSDNFRLWKIPRYDLILIGAGPCGLAAASEFKHAGLNYLHLESGQLAQTVYNFPTNIRLFSHPRYLEIGKVHFHPEPYEPPTREQYLEYLNMASSRLGLVVKQHSKVVGLTSNDKDHYVRYIEKGRNVREACAPNIVVASGGYYAPQLLGIPGEDQPNVYHYFRSELPFHNERVLVVGGRNSAIDAVITLVEKQAEVIHSYRGARLPRKKIKPWLLPIFDKARKSGSIRFLYRTVPRSIHNKQVKLKSDGKKNMTIDVDRVFLLTGYGPDYATLKSASVPFHKRHKRPLFNPKTLETKKSGIFLCGTIVLKWQGEKASIDNTRGHGKIILNNLR